MGEKPRQTRFIAIALASAVAATACTAVSPASGPARFGILTIESDAMVGSDRAAEVYILGLPVGGRRTAPAPETVRDPAGPKTGLSPSCDGTRTGCVGSRAAEVSAP